MNIKDALFEWLLTAIDLVTDLISFGAWSRWQGARVTDLIVSNKELE